MQLGLSPLSVWFSAESQDTIHKENKWMATQKRTLPAILLPVTPWLWYYNAHTHPWRSRDLSLCALHGDRYTVLQTSCSSANWVRVPARLQHAPNGTLWVWCTFMACQSMNFLIQTEGGYGMLQLYKQHTHSHIGQPVTWAAAHSLTQYPIVPWYNLLGQWLPWYQPKIQFR